MEKAKEGSAHETALNPENPEKKRERKFAPPTAKNQSVISPSKQKIIEKYIGGIEDHSKSISRAPHPSFAGRDNSKDYTSPKDENRFKLQLKMGLCSSREKKSKLKFYANLAASAHAVFKLRMMGYFQKFKGKDSLAGIDMSMYGGSGISGE